MQLIATAITKGKFIFSENNIHFMSVNLNYWADCFCCNGVFNLLHNFDAILTHFDCQNGQTLIILCLEYSAAIFGSNKS